MQRHFERGWPDEGVQEEVIGHAEAKEGRRQSLIAAEDLMPKCRPEGRRSIVVNASDMSILKDGGARWGWVMVVEVIERLFYECWMALVIMLLLLIMTISRIR